MKLTNEQIYSYAMNLNKAFDNENQNLPVKLSFYILKNKKILTDLAREIELARMELVQNMKDATQDEKYIKIEELAKIEQEVNIYTIDFEELDKDLILTTGQMESIMFMIN